MEKHINNLKKSCSYCLKIEFDLMLKLIAEHDYPVISRFSDLDTNRHLNASAFEDIANSGRYALLADHGWPIGLLVEKNLILEPVNFKVQFENQQTSNTNLIVRTRAYLKNHGHLLWQSEIINKETQKRACVILLETITTNIKNQAVNLYKVKETTKSNDAIEFEDVPRFSGKGRRVKTVQQIRHVSRNFFGSYPPSAYTQICEETRWFFYDKIGVSLESVVTNDTTLFWMHGNMQIFKPIQAGEKVDVYTWVDRIDKIRCSKRQDIHRKENGELLASSIDGYLVVSVLKSRPKRIPEDLKKAFWPYTENKN